MPDCQNIAKKQHSITDHFHSVAQDMKSMHILGSPHNCMEHRVNSVVHMISTSKVLQTLSATLPVFN